MMYKHMLTARLYIIVSCWIGGMLLSVSGCDDSNRNTGPVERTSDSSSDSAEKTIWRKLSLIGGDGPKSYAEVIDHFAQALNTNGGQSVINFTRNIHRIAEQHKWEHDGFEWEIEKCSKDGTMKLRMNGKHSTQTGYLDIPYSTAYKGQFNKYLREAEKSKGAAVFVSDSKRILTIPVGPFLTVYHFSKNAKDEEIRKFWSATIEFLKSFGPEKLEKYRYTRAVVIDKPLLIFIYASRLKSRIARN